MSLFRVLDTFSSKQKVLKSELGVSDHKTMFVNSCQETQRVHHPKSSSSPLPKNFLNLPCPFFGQIAIPPQIAQKHTLPISTKEKQQFLHWFCVVIDEEPGMETRQSILWGFHQAWRGWSCKHHGIWDTVVKAHLAGVSGSPRSSVRSVPPRRLFFKEKLQASRLWDCKLSELHKANWMDKPQATKITAFNKNKSKHIWGNSS